MAARLAVLALSLLLPAVAGAQALFTEGRHFQRIDPPQPTRVADGKVEVVEVFSYACVHCANFEPYLQAWKKEQSDQVVLRPLPAVFSQAWEPYARAYHGAKAIGELERLHQPLFDALHRDRKPLRTLDDIAGFAADLGIDREAFLAAANSDETTAKLAEGHGEVQAFRIEGTPSMVVNGKYRVPAAGGQMTLQIVDYLVAQELAAGSTD